MADRPAQRPRCTVRRRSTVQARLSRVFDHARPWPQAGCPRGVAATRRPARAAPPVASWIVFATRPTPDRDLTPGQSLCSQFSRCPAASRRASTWPSRRAAPSAVRSSQPDPQRIGAARQQLLGRRPLPAVASRPQRPQSRRPGAQRQAQSRRRQERRRRPALHQPPRGRSTARTPTRHPAPCRRRSRRRRASMSAPASNSASIISTSSDERRPVQRRLGVTAHERRVDVGARGSTSTASVSSRRGRSPGQSVSTCSSVRAPSGGPPASGRAARAARQALDVARRSLIAFPDDPQARSGSAGRRPRRSWSRTGRRGRPGRPVASVWKSPSSACRRPMIPSTIPAKPYSTPARIASTVDLPISARGGVRSIIGKRRGARAKAPPARSRRPGRSRRRGTRRPS